MKTQTDKSALIHGLRSVLADTYSLYLKTLIYHWNVEGPHFPYLHKLFEKEYEELFEAVDRIAERIRALGDYIPGRFTDLTRGASIVEETELPDARGMIQRLLEGHRIAAEVIRAVILICEKAEDAATENLLADRALAHEKSAWMLGSCLKKAASETQLKQSA